MIRSLTILTVAAAVVGVAYWALFGVSDMGDRFA